MTDRKLESRILYFVIIILIGTLLVLIFGMQISALNQMDAEGGGRGILKGENISKFCEGFWNCVTPDAWVQSFGTLIGSFLGALLAGGIAIYVLKSQIKAETKKDLQDELNKFMKFYENYMRNLSPIMGNLGIVEDKIKEQEFHDIKYSNDINIDIVPDLLKVDTSNLTHAPEVKVNRINRGVELVTFQLSLFGHSNNSLHLEHFIDNLQSLKDSVRELDEYKESLQGKARK